MRMERGDDDLPTIIPGFQPFSKREDPLAKLRVPLRMQAVGKSDRLFWVLRKQPLPDHSRLLQPASSTRAIMRPRRAAPYVGFSWRAF